MSLYLYSEIDDAGIKTELSLISKPFNVRTEPENKLTNFIWNNWISIIPDVGEFTLLVCWKASRSYPDSSSFIPHLWKLFVNTLNSSSNKQCFLEKNFESFCFAVANHKRENFMKYSFWRLTNSPYLWNLFGSCTLISFF